MKKSLKEWLLAAFIGLCFFAWLDLIICLSFPGHNPIIKPAIASAISLIGSGIPSAPSCPTGTFVGGDTETFECGSGVFQTYDNGTNTWDITGTLDTYDSADKMNGSYSMSLDLAADATAWVEANNGAGDQDWSVKFAYYLPALAQWKELIIYSAKAAAGTPITTYACYLSLGYNGTGPYFRLRNQATTYTGNIYIAASAWYWIQIDYTDGGNIELSVWNASDVEDDNSPQTVAEAGNINGQYHFFGQLYATASYDAPKQYWDDCKFQAAGGDI